MLDVCKGLPIVTYLYTCNKLLMLRVNKKKTSKMCNVNVTTNKLPLITSSFSHITFSWSGFQREMFLGVKKIVQLGSWKIRHTFDLAVIIAKWKWEPLLICHATLWKHTESASFWYGQSKNKCSLCYPSHLRFSIDRLARLRLRG